MSSDQILLLFFGLPLAILGVGLRRALGPRILLVLLAGAAAACYALILETALLRSGRGLPLPMIPGGSVARAFGLYCLAAGILGALAATLLRLRGKGSRS